MQILIKYDKIYVINATTYNSLVNSIKKKINCNLFTLHLNGILFTSNDFSKLSNNDILIFKPELKGGFVKFGTVVIKILPIMILISVIYTFLAGAIGGSIIYKFKPDIGKYGFMWSLENIEGYPINFSQLFYASLAIYVVVTIILINTVNNKSDVCNIPVPTIDLIIIPILPIITIIGLILLTSVLKLKVPENLAYFITSIILLLGTYFTYYRSELILKKWRESDFNSGQTMNMIFHYIIAYSLLRFTLLFSRPESLSGILYHVLSAVFAVFAIIPQYLQITFNDVSGENVICPH